LISNESQNEYSASKAQGTHLGDMNQESLSFFRRLSTADIHSNEQHR